LGNDEYGVMVSLYDPRKGEPITQAAFGIRVSEAGYLGRRRNSSR
jgi:hypothetical protein